MKKTFSLLLVICLFFASCESGENKTNDGVSSQNPSSSSSAKRYSNQENQVIANDVQQEMLLKALLDEYLPLYGIMIGNEDWDDPEQIPITMFYAWYRDYINSVTTVEERMEKYKIDAGEYAYGWAYPAVEFEPFVQKYFNVSQEYLRNGDVYQPAEDVYWIPGGDGGKIRIKIKVESADDLRINENILTVRLSTSYLGDYSDTIYKELVLDISEDVYKYLSCRSV